MAPVSFSVVYGYIYSHSPVPRGRTRGLGRSEVHWWLLGNRWVNSPSRRVPQTSSLLCVPCGSYMGLSPLCAVCVWGTAVGGSRSRRYIVYAPATSSPAESTSAAPWLTLCPLLCYCFCFGDGTPATV